MRILERQLRQLGKIAENLLGASRAMRHEVVLSRVVVEVQGVLERAIEETAQLFEERQHRLVVEVAEGGLAVDVDPERVAEAFAALLENAARYTPPRGSIRVAARREGADVVVTVEDDGKGIAADELGLVFDLFSQGDQGLAHVSGGLGIGLAVAKRLVDEHHGSIDARSDGLGKGSRFTVRLPHVARGARATAAGSSSAPGAGEAPRRVLIADDNRDSVEMLQLLLEHWGHVTCAAFDGPEAIRAAADFRPDVVFLDIGLPGLDGYEVVRQMREMPSMRSLPIVAVSGYARAEDRARALASGFTAHVAKPIDIASIARFIEGRGEAP